MANSVPVGENEMEKMGMVCPLNILVGWERLRILLCNFLNPMIGLLSLLLTSLS